jgi:hypothetical protein
VFVAGNRPLPNFGRSTAAKPRKLGIRVNRGRANETSLLPEDYRDFAGGACRIESHQRRCQVLCGAARVACVRLYLRRPPEFETGRFLRFDSAAGNRHIRKYPPFGVRREPSYSVILKFGEANSSWLICDWYP